MNFNEIVYTRKVYQDTRYSSTHWRQANRIFHPLTEGQYMDRFRVGDRVTMRLRLNNPNRKMYISGLITNILPYDMTETHLGAYNIDSAFNTIPFTRVLVLDP